MSYRLRDTFPSWIASPSPPGQAVQAADGVGHRGLVGEYREDPRAGRGVPPGQRAGGRRSRTPGGRSRGHRRLGPRPNGLHLPLPPGQRGPERALALDSRRDVQPVRPRGSLPRRPAAPAPARPSPCQRTRQNVNPPGLAKRRAPVPGAAPSPPAPPPARPPAPPKRQRDRRAGPGGGRRCRRPRAAPAGTRHRTAAAAWRIPRRAPERRQRAAGHLAPERHPGAERAGREVQENGQPPDRDRGHGLRAFGSDATTRS